ncbi:Radical SAM domain protein [Desulfovibrio sp. X2]|uniref:TIGR01212 family radical SAM protein n=1 Tax=Desulfovibrio sp. X2 TaxID=941449 RepID=UPI000358753D|nr:TIGR01212 family radical SAM protein [Desulfovibrio sp. X2]EPR43837.1 Radical SAM domain protein [Desulfovibrio sp. X2]
MTTARHRALSAHLRAGHGRRVQKIPLDVAAACPNRDGTLSTGGCTFCSPRAAGSGLGHLSVAEQWEIWRARFHAKYGPSTAFLAYLQDHTATHLPFPRLEHLLRQAAALPDCIGICLSTRPDTLRPEHLALLRSLGLPETWLDMGLQSAHDATLARINRGHDAACFARATTAAAGVGLQVCAHLILGLPGETEAHWLSSVDFLNALPVAGIKFHNLFVSRGSLLFAAWEQGSFVPPSREAYAQGLARCLARLRPDVVVHRLHADPAPGELAAPDWASDRPALRRAIDSALADLDVTQGRDYTIPPSPIPHRRTP